MNHEKTDGCSKPKRGDAADKRQRSEYIRAQQLAQKTLSENQTIQDCEQ